MMATEVPNTSILSEKVGPSPGTASKEHGGNPNDVVVSLNYYDDPGDGSLPEPVYVEK